MPSTWISTGPTQRRQPQQLRLLLSRPARAPEKQLFARRLGQGHNTARPRTGLSHAPRRPTTRGPVRQSPMYVVQVTRPRIGQMSPTPPLLAPRSPQQSVQFSMLLKKTTAAVTGAAL